MKHRRVRDEHHLDVWQLKLISDFCTRLNDLIEVAIRCWFTIAGKCNIVEPPQVIRV